MKYLKHWCQQKYWPYLYNSFIKIDIFVDFSNFTNDY